ncbi:MAG: HEPN domain-containing protein [Candidatus Methylomirabilales bacterium]
MNEKPENLRAVRQWVEKAEHDLRNAEHTLTLKEDCPSDTVCFHAQQCVEKYLKALLLVYSVDFPKTHDLRVLMQRVSLHIELGLEISEIVALNRYTVEARYPGDWEPITRDDAEEAVAIARKAREAVRACLPKEAVRG